MDTPKFINKVLLHLNSMYPNPVHMKEYFRTLFPSNESNQHDMRLSITETLLADELVDLSDDKKSKVFLVINKKGQEVLREGGYEKYIEKRASQTDRQNEIENLTYKKLKYDTANSARIFKTYWWTFGLSVAAFVISTLLLILKLIDIAN